MSNLGASNGDDQPPTPWDQRVVRAMSVADSARSWANVLRVIGLLVIAGSLVGNYLLIYNDDFADFGDGGLSGRVKLGQLLQQSVFPVAFGGVVLALSFFVMVHASRLDLDIVIADNDETTGPAADDSVWQAPPPPPM
ncbi:MAG TPA: hypothetical protein VH761_08540 [Ilumatobacteraceae bacterium]|jgi:hypothetical protein